MLHPFFRLLAAKPQLLLDHASAYADLATLQAAAALTAWRLRLVLALTAGLALLLGLMLTGVSLMLLALMPWQAMQAPWLLVAVPAVPLLLAAALGWRLRQPLDGAWLQELRSQWQADTLLLREAGAE
jgi:hypothetical protein